ARLSNKLTARSVAAAKPGRHGDGTGVWLDGTKPRRPSWGFRCTFAGRVRESGLGSATKVSLAQAREKALAYHALIADGVDPVERRRSEKQEPAVKTFGQAVTEYHTAKSPGWRSEKYAGQWLASVNQFAAGLSSMPVDQVDTEAVLATLKPVWLSKSVTAEKLRGRIETVLDFAKVKNWRSGENPARWRGHLDHLLPRPKHTRKHHSAMDYIAVRAFVGKLRGLDSITALALEFLILTAA